ncbi:MAG: tetratricopeptide repeat protein [Bacteroidales bacterium]|nr:tetratricopeptide repeat protein [Bacteroidales bacterium]MBR4215966.1 tetratricopeptide repeat protein [Bacteroidales bacterium]
MANTENNAQQDQLEIVESKFGQTEQYIEENRNKIFTVIAIIAAVILGYMAYQKYVKVPKEDKAAAQMFQAENYFERDSFNLALNGDGNYPGFLKIMSDYSGTKAGNNAKYYAGICYFHTQEFDKAIECLNGFSANDKSLDPIAKGLIGDCWSEKGDFAKAQKYYNDAIKSAEGNVFVAPIFLNKLGKILEKQNNYQEALNVYNKIKAEYPNSNEGRTIDRDIEKMNIQLGK